MSQQNLDKPSAAWIWAQRPVDLADTMAQFRLEFDWVGSGEVFWEGFADTLYTIWCNGVCLGVGPVASTSKAPFVSRWTLNHHAQTGRNVLAIQVWPHADRRDCSDYCALEGGLVGWLHAGNAVIPTGPDWLARDAVGYSMPAPDKPFRPFQESRLVWADLRQEPLNWMKPEFEPKPEEWKPARVVHPAEHPERKSLRPWGRDPFGNVGTSTAVPGDLPASAKAGGRLWLTRFWSTSPQHSHCRLLRHDTLHIFDAC